MKTLSHPIVPQTIPKTLPAFFKYIWKKQWKKFVAIQFLQFAWSIDHTFFPLFLMMLIDALTSFQGDRAEIWGAISTPLWMGAGLWIGIELAYRGAGYLTVHAIPQMEATVRMEMFDYVQHHSHVYFSNHMAGSIANKISDMPRSMTHIFQMMFSLFLPVCLGVVIAIVLFSLIHPFFGVILTLWLTVHLTTCFVFAKKCTHYSDIHAESRTTLSRKIVDSFTNHLNVKLFSRQRFEHQFLSSLQNQERERHTASLLYVEKMKLALGIACFLGAGVAINWLLISLWQQDKLTAGEVVFVFNTTWNIVIMAWLAGLELPTLFKEFGVCKQALTVIQDKHDIMDPSEALPLKISNGEIKFENVTFKYTPNRNLFQDKNISLKAGHKVGLVGFSGSGKTTFVHLILRYYDIEKGRILIDGQNIASVSQNSLRTQIAMIPQDTSLFHRTLMENIRYGRLDATDEDVIEASKKAHCHEFIEKMPEGYHSMAGERGVKLSGGQRQRIAIARAILKNAPILILDEATSSLDSVTEKQIQDGLSHLMSGRTSIVIAHRLSTLSGMDRILVFKEGKVIEDGTHEELLSTEGHYATLWNMQAGGFLPDDEEE